jgi:hypothetical protein
MLKRMNSRCSIMLTVAFQEVDPFRPNQGASAGVVGDEI